MQAESGGGRGDEVGNEDDVANEGPVLFPMLAELLEKALKQAANNAKYLRDLVNVLPKLQGFYDATSREMLVPKETFKKLFPRTVRRNGDLDMGNFNRGLPGIVHGDGLTRRGFVRLTFYETGARRKGLIIATSEVEMLKSNCVQFFGQENVTQSDCHAEWFAIDGFSMEAFCPRKIGESRSGVVMGEAREYFDAIRQQYPKIGRMDAEVAQRSAPFALQQWQSKYDYNPVPWHDLSLLFAFFTNLLIDILLEAGGDKPFVDKITEKNVSPWIWERCRDKTDLRWQLMCFADVNWLIQLLGERTAILAGSTKKEDKRRCKNLRRMQFLLGGGPRPENEHPGHRNGSWWAHLQVWVDVSYEGNSSRAELSKNGSVVGPPKHVVRSLLETIPMCNREYFDLHNALAGTGFEVAVFGRLPGIAEFPQKKYAVIDLSHRGSRGIVQSRCYILRQRQLYVRSENRCVKFNTLKLQHSAPHRATFYIKTTSVRYSFLMPIAPRQQECLAANGSGQMTVSDFGGRCITWIEVKCVDNDPHKLQVTAREQCRGLSQWIITRAAKSAKLRSFSAQSRAFRLRGSSVAQLTFLDLLAKEEQFGDNLLRALAKHLGILKAHGMATSNWQTELQTLLEMDGENGGDATKAEIEADLVREIFDEFRDLLGDGAKELKLCASSGHPLGLLWTPEVQLQFERHCDLRDLHHLPRLTPRVFLRRNVEKRMNRQAKGLDRRTRGHVRKVQNDSLKEMVPSGTSLVVAPRLNFHTFGRLARCVKLYFGFLALCNFHDRLHRYCTNHGAVLLNACEGKTTKRCLDCGKDVRVGGSEVFKCPNCKTRRPRDVKVRFGGFTSRCCPSYFDT